LICHAERSEASAFRSHHHESMGRIHSYYVYILASRSRTLYTGITNDIHTRMRQHKEARGSLFASKYKIERFVYFEEHKYVRNAIAREKEIKGWTRNKKVELVESKNLTWEDLSAGWTFVNRYEPKPKDKLRAATTLKMQDTAIHNEQQMLRCAQHDKPKKS
jgi:putative endonuclease